MIFFERKKGEGEAEVRRQKTEDRRKILRQ
jgi:hypothetical protein